MIRLFILWFISLFAFFNANGQSASSILNKTIATYNNSKGISAQFVMSSNQGKAKGKIEMSGNKFRIITDDLKCWYDGSDQWAYSSMTGEVNITTPTAEELQMSNPYVALTALKSNCKVYNAFTQVEGFYTLKFVPKKKGTNIKQILLYITKGSFTISKAYFETTEGNNYTTRITNYKTVSIPSATFKFDKNLVPEGVEVVDLR